MSNSQVKKLKARGKEKLIKSFLIGQLGKNSAVQDNPICLSIILEEAFNVLEDASRLVGGRTVILECEDCQGLISHYEKHGFKVLQKDDGKQGGLVTMYAFLSKI